MTLLFSSQEQERGDEELMKTFTLEDFKKWGSKGGKKTGITKVRGDSEYYRNIAKKRKLANN